MDLYEIADLILEITFVIFCEAKIMLIVTGDMCIWQVKLTGAWRRFRKVSRHSKKFGRRYVLTADISKVMW